MSSTIFAVCGSSSLTQAPDLPCCWNLKIDRATGKLLCPEVMPVMRWPMRTLPGSSVPANLFERRLVVEQVHLRRAARLVQEDDALGLGREMRQARQSAGGRGLRRGEAVLREQRAERRDADAGAGARKEMTPS